MHEQKTAMMYLESFKNKYKSIWSSFETNHTYISQHDLHSILSLSNDSNSFNSISMHELNTLGMLIPWDYSKLIAECTTQKETLLLTSHSVSVLSELPAMCIYICQSDEPHSGFWLAINSTPAGYAINILRATPQGLRFNALLLKDYGSFLDSLTVSLRAGFSSIPNTNEFQVSKMVANSLSHLIPIFSTLVSLCLNQHFMTVITNNKFDYQEQPMIINIAN